ncbi:MAG: PTS sugar transporter subunit IIA [Deltaproteobacteria bacterium]|nr:PTS sugar transporter subunit IIA [Deltaproteobacteria bacterium]
MFFSPQRIFDTLQAKTKTELLEELSLALAQTEPGLEAKSLFKVLKAREDLGSTGIGKGVAIPHGKVANLDKTLLALGRSPEGIDFASQDGEKCFLFFVLLGPTEATGEHLRALAQISRLLKKEELIKQLYQAPDAQSLYEILNQALPD